MLTPPREDAAAPCHNDAPLPGGLFVGFVLFLMPVVPFVWLSANLGQHLFPLVWFVPWFFAPVLYNGVPSRFEAQHTHVDAYTCGVLIGVFSATLPFARLLVYEEGVELRVMFQRYFLPYPQLDAFETKVRFLSSFQLTLRSDLPGVPRKIRVSALRSAALLEQVNALRAAALAPAQA